MKRHARPETTAVIHLAAFRAALRSFLRESERIARANGLTPQRHLFLLMIKGAPDGSEQATISELTERLKLAQSTVTELVRRAESARLIERQQSETDARVAHLRLTDEGERRLARVFTRLDIEREQLRKTFAELDSERPPDEASGIGRRRPVVVGFSRAKRPAPEPRPNRGDRSSATGCLTRRELISNGVRPADWATRQRRPEPAPAVWASVRVT